MIPSPTEHDRYCALGIVYANAADEGGCWPLMAMKLIRLLHAADYQLWSAGLAIDRLEHENRELLERCGEVEPAAT